MKKICLMLLLLFPILTGCYNYRELNDLAIVTAISIAKDNDAYKVTVQVVNSKKEQDVSKGTQPNFITYSKSSKSIQIALREMVLSSPKKIYGAHIQILLIDEELAKEEIKEVLDWLLRDPEIRDEFYVLISQNKDALDILTPLDNLSSENITNSLKTTNKYLGLSSLTTYNDLINIYLNNKQELALPSLKIVRNKPEATEEQNLEESDTYTDLEISNMAVFKDNTMLGYLTQKESIAYNFVKNNITNTLITTNYDDGFIVNEIIESKTMIDANPKKNKITIKIKGTASISEVTTTQNIKDLNSFKKVQEKLNTDVENLIKDSIKSTIEKYNSDIYGFEDLYYKTDYKYYNKIKDKWYEEIFKNIDIEVKSDITIQEKGNLTGGIYHE